MELFLESFPKIFISGIVMTLPLAVISFVLAMVLAIFCALIQYAKVPVMKYVVQFYIWIFRGTPMLVQLFIMYFGMQSIGVRISAITAAIIVFSLIQALIVQKPFADRLKVYHKDKWKPDYV